MTLVIGTAGHIDHGKTTLLRALTGIDADRLPEERRRGLTIDLGYAHGSPDGGPEVDFVDVPGHDGLVGNMLVGVGEIDAALLVVAADDGPRAQTWEHVGLLDAMAIAHGIVAITKADLVSDDRALAVAAEISTSLAATHLGGSPVVVVSGTSGAGLDELRARLASLRDRATTRTGRRHAGVWLAVDRVFTVRGHGVVVTGSSRGAPVRTGDAVGILPGSTLARVRAIQVHDAAVDASSEPGRLALNLAGVDRDRVHRGQVVISRTEGDTEGHDAFAPFETDRLLVALDRPAALPGRPLGDPWPPRDATELRLHVGTDQVGVRIGRRGRLADASGPEPFALLRLDRAVASAIGERFVLRRPRPAGLLAGGVVLDADVPRGRARARLRRDRLVRLVAAVATGDAASVAAARLELHGVNGSMLAPDVQLSARSALLDRVAEYHEGHPDRPGLPLSSARSCVAAAIGARVSVEPATLARLAEATLAIALAQDALEQLGDKIRSSSFTAPVTDPQTEQAGAALVALLDVPAPPPLAVAADQVGCSADVLRVLEQEGRIVVIGTDLAWSADSFEQLRDAALALADAGPLTPAVLRDATGTSRKYVLALLEELDRRGILKRTPAGHVRGPRA